MPEPVERIPTDPEESAPEPGTALCLSGGGYRAMVFHVGVLWRLYEASLLGGVARISSVSGGSITAGVLGLKWNRLIRTDIKNYKLDDALDCPVERTLALAETPTRLKRMDDRLQERLINWGYAVCDAALRRHVDQHIAKGQFPYPAAGV